MSGGENPNAATSVSTRPREGKKRRRKSLPFSQVRKCRAQAARVLSKLLLAAREKRHGTSIKSLTLDARKIDFPSATHAIVCETVKVLPLLKVLINDVKMTENVVGDDENDKRKKSKRKRRGRTRGSRRGKRSAAASPTSRRRR